MKIYSLLFGICLHSAFCLAGHKTEEQTDSLKTYNLGEVIITSSKANLFNNASEIYINKTTIENTTGTDITKAFDHETGIFSAPTSKNESKIYIRGFDQAEISVMIDGVPVYQPHDGLVDFSNLPANIFEKITVSKGVSSMLYGSNSMGGIINLITKESDKPFSADFNIENGFASKISAGANGILNNIYYAINGTYSKSNGYYLSSDFPKAKNENGDLRDNSQFDNFGGMIKVGINNFHNFDLAYSLLHIDNSKGIPLDIYASKPRYWKFSDWQKNIHNFIYRTFINSAILLKGNFYYENFYNVLNSYDDGSFTLQTKPYAFHSVYDDYSFGVNLYSSILLIDKGATRGYFIFRKDVHREQGNFNQPFKKYETADFSFGTEQDINFSEKLFSNFGLGGDVLKPVYSNGANLRSSLSSLNGNIGIGSNINDALSINAGVSYKSRFPVLIELYIETAGKNVSNPNLVPERALKSELGFSYKTSQNSSLTLSYYRSDVKDLIKQVALPDGLKQYQNVGKALLTGAEAAFKWHNGNLDLTFNYTYLYAKNKSDNAVSDILEYRPKHLAALHAEYLFNFGLALSVDYSFKADEYGVNLETLAYVKMSDYSLINLNASQEILNFLRAYIKVNNLTDKYYEGEYAFPQPGREFIFGLKANI